MNQDPNNLAAPNPATPANPGFPNPAAAAAPSMEAPAAPATPTEPAAPSVPEVPTIDPALLQQAIADVPDEALATTPEVPSAVSLDNIGAETPAAPEVNPLTTATPTADFSTGDQTATPGTDPAMANPEEQKTTPSVAFNDPANQPDAPAPHAIKTPAFIDKLKEKPVVLIVGGATIIIIALVLIIAFAV